VAAETGDVYAFSGDTCSKVNPNFVEVVDAFLILDLFLNCDSGVRQSVQ
jgi:hypothetical protein